MKLERIGNIAFLQCPSTGPNNGKSGGKWFNIVSVRVTYETEFVELHSITDYDPKTAKVFNREIMHKHYFTNVEAEEKRIQRALNEPLPLSFETSFLNL